MSFRLTGDKARKVLKLIAKEQFRCHICHKSLKSEIAEFLMWYSRYQLGQPVAAKKREAIDLNIDHVRPLSRGGTNDTSNLHLAHASCNLRKGSHIKTEALTGKFFRYDKEQWGIPS